MNNFDLHMHSTASDGSDTIPELLEKLLADGITTFSVTDHDTIDGALEMDQLVPASVNYVRGIEFSCITPCGKCHILGYSYDPRCEEFQNVLEYGKDLRVRKLSQRLSSMEKQFGIRMTESELNWLQSQKSPGKPHIGKILVERGLYPDIKTAILEVVNHCKVPNSRVAAERVIPAILAAGGIPVWAHPLGGEGERLLTDAEFVSQLDYLKSIGIQGLECFYSRYTSDQIQYLQKQAGRCSLLISAGSDYHGRNKVNITLGKLNAENMPVLPTDVTLLGELF